MNSLTLVIGALCLFALAYRYYAAFIAAKVLVLDNARPTPAHTQKDGADYMPMNKVVLFGHHFAAIAGAGPLIGPVLAAQYGYLPGAVWILLGSVFAGGVHDIIVLFASVRLQGQALHRIARAVVGPVAAFATALASLFIVIVAMAGLAIAVVNALKGSPWAFFTVALTIPIALLVGLHLFRWRKGRILEGSAIGVALLLAAVVAGHWVQNSSLAGMFSFDEKSLKLMLPVYGFLAAVLPVWLLLAPRDYLSTYLKIGTVALLAVGIFFVHPPLLMPALTRFIHGGGPVVPGPVWPYVCITIACGAISGFHALVASGTTPKMLNQERDIPMIGYGAMLVEGFVAMMALVAATVLVPGDYFAVNASPAGWSALAAAGMKPDQLPLLSSLIQENLMHRPGGAVSLAVGMASIFDKIPGLSGILKYWYHFAIMFEALFILTTIDAGTRVARYILGEILGAAYPPFAKPSWVPGSLICGALVSLAWGYLLYGGDVSTIWPMFGVANQLLAVLVLALGTTLILRTARIRYALITLVPFFFLLVTVFTAGVMNILNVYWPRGESVNVVLSIVMLALVLTVVIDSASSWVTILKERKQGARVWVLGKAPSPTAEGGAAMPEPVA